MGKFLEKFGLDAEETETTTAVIKLKDQQETEQEKIDGWRKELKALE